MTRAHTPGLTWSRRGFARRGHRSAPFRPTAERLRFSGAKRVTPFSARRYCKGFRGPDTNGFRWEILMTQAAIRKSDTGWAWPVPGHYRLNERVPAVRQGGGQFGDARGHGAHNGIDISGHLGAGIVAAADGVVFNLQPNPSNDYGNILAIEHAGKIFSVYAHLQQILVAPGSAIKAGQVVALTGDSGNTPSLARVHLHFEVRVGSCLPVSMGGRVASPWTYLSRPPAVPSRGAWWRH